MLELGDLIWYTFIDLKFKVHLIPSPLCTKIYLRTTRESAVLILNLKIYLKPLQERVFEETVLSVGPLDL